MSKKIAIVLSGCGVQDGSEIHESVLTLLAVVKAGATPLFYAPSGPQAKVTNHLSGQDASDERDMLEEAARIARGEIKDLGELSATDADAVIFPGGFGAALNLCDFAVNGAGCSVHPQVERVVMDFHQAKKPIGAICIAPAIIGRTLGSEGVELTIGTDAGTASALEQLGVKHIDKNVNEIHIDATHKVVSTPAYMLAANIAEAEAGISKLVTEVIALA